MLRNIFSRNLSIKSMVSFAIRNSYRLVSCIGLYYAASLIVGRIIPQGGGNIAVTSFIMYTGALSLIVMAFKIVERKNIHWQDYFFGFQNIKMLLRFIGLNLLISLAIIPAMLCFIVPGVYLLLIWILSPYVLIHENKGILNALKRSAALTKGIRWQLLRWLLLMLACFFIIGACVGLTIGAGIVDPASVSRASVLIPYFIYVAFLFWVILVMHITLVSVYLRRV